MAEPKSPSSYTRGGSKLITTEHSTRHMKSYTVFDAELNNISMLNGWATLFFSLASFCASAGLGVWSNLFITDTPSELAKKYGGSVQLIAFGLTAVFAIIGTCSVLSRRSQVAQIKREAGEEMPGFWESCRIAFGRDR